MFFLVSFRSVGRQMLFFFFFTLDRQVVSLFSCRLYDKLNGLTPGSSENDITLLHVTLSKKAKS